MNTLVKAIVLSISTALVAIPAMAAPQDHQPQKHQTYNKAPALQHQAPHYQHQNKHPAQPSHYKQTHRKSVDPSRDWRVGQKVPTQYHSQAYKVDHKQYKKLNKPSRNQQWIKVNGDYILTNVMTHSIIKIIAA